MAKTKNTTKKKVDTGSSTTTEKDKAQQKKAESKKSEYILVMLYPPGESIDRDDEITIVKELEVIKTPKENNRIIILLNSGGGNIYSSIKIVKLLRTKADEIVIVVPQYAKSAATMMCLGANQIVMGEQSELGPLDKPIEHPDREGFAISALDVIQGLDYLQKRAKEHTFEIAKDLIQKAGLPRKDALDSASQISLGLVNPIICKLDPMIISQSMRLLRIAEQYGREFLNMSMAKNWKASDERKERLINAVIDIFVWRYPDHAFAITRGEARSVLLNILNSEKYELWPKLWGFYIANRDNKIIKFYNEKDLVK